MARPHGHIALDFGEAAGALVHALNDFPYSLAFKTGFLAEAAGQQTEQQAMNAVPMPVEGIAAFRGFLTLFEICQQRVAIETTRAFARRARDIKVIWLSFGRPFFMDQLLKVASQAIHEGPFGGAAHRNGDRSEE